MVSSVSIVFLTNNSPIVLNSWKSGSVTSLPWAHLRGIFFSTIVDIALSLEDLLFPAVRYRKIPHGGKLFKNHVTFWSI